ncbi:methyltransferase domain-containing protein [Streptomyces sp. 21So2-11]|uniref:methyltransferase domain-containing protein n=1 Tax=Streptomyces sp. 21So2-11 TaxID=3144408 RepID=UPI00321A9DED
MTDHDRARTALGRALLQSGALTSDWIPSFSAVPRSAFLPDVIWPHDMKSGESVRLSRQDDLLAWRRSADANVPIVTQWDDGHHDGGGPGRLSTSSASMPSVVFAMLRDLEVGAGVRVLEIGTGTGWNAALLAHRVGQEHVTSIEVDSVVANTAREALRRFGLPVKVITGDGFGGDLDGAPYDRIIATCGLRSLPVAWVRQLHPGGLILAPWGTDHGHLDVTVRLTVSDDGLSASGPFLEPVEFMKLRAQRLTWPELALQDPSVSLNGAVTSYTSITAADLGLGRFDVAHFAVGLQVRDCLRVVAEKRDGMQPVWFYSLRDRSCAAVMFHDGADSARVFHAGPRRIWDEVEAAWLWWDVSGRPDFPRFGLTVTAEGQTAWIDTPEHPVPIVG